MKKMTTLMLAALILNFGSSCTNDNKQKTETEPTPTSSQVTANDLKVGPEDLSEAKATIKTVHGNIVFKFYPKHAPNTTTRIIQLIEKGFYDGLTFHRVVPNFVIQGGDPLGNGTGGSGQNLKAEFNSLQHVKGTVAMARAQDPDSADSQFYIALNTLKNLDGKYTIFGKVVEGLDLIEKVRRGDKMLSVSFEK
ncbi:MAG: peptidyl-prolyl cis-trans isomerase [Halobacteriovorax sp.]|nr:peptidyl-prolyl cis-trans isomerase [Halobacteriovorax sp.]|tara:strand:- start:567265 stop:567846 length:582 start_codon:yes stop_codon:yes gene_type:complete